MKKCKAISCIDPINPLVILIMHTNSLVESIIYGHTQACAVYEDLSVYFMEFRCVCGCSFIGQKFVK